MDPYAHATADELTEVLGQLYRTILFHPDAIGYAWLNVPLHIRAAAGDLAAADELHGQ